MLFSLKILLTGIAFIFASLTFNCATSSLDEKGKTVLEREINKNFIKIEEKLNYFDKKLEQLEFNSSSRNNAFDVHEIIKNITRLIINSNNQLIGSNKKIIKKIDKLETFYQKCEDKLNEKEFGLLNGNDRESNNMWSEVTSLCHSTCKDKVVTWANSTAKQFKTSFERMNFCLKSERKASNNVCHSNPCFYGGNCVSSSTGNDYICLECPKFSSGSRCQNVNCTAENKCWNLSDTLYVVIETKLNWTAAKAKCEKEAMTLAMPKNEESTSFLYNQLKPIYSNQQYLWIGIKREAKGWFWVDGRAVGEYTGGWEEMKSKTDSVFGQLELNTGTRKWIYGTGEEQRYPICETLISLIKF